MGRPSSQPTWFPHVVKTIDPDSTLGEMLANEEIVGGMSDAEMYHHFETSLDNPATAYQQRLLYSTSSVNEPTRANVISPMGIPNCLEFMNEQLGIEKKMPMELAILEVGLLDSGLDIMENNEASPYQEQYLDAPSNTEQPLKEYLVTFVSEYLKTESNNIKESATIYLLDERTAFKEHHEYETMENNQASTYQQLRFVSTSSVNVPTMANVRLPMTSPSIQGSLTEPAILDEKYMLADIMTMTEPDRSDIIENNEASANQQQCLGAPSSLNTTIPSDKMLLKRKYDQGVGPMTNNGMHDGTSNANFLMPFTDQQRIRSKKKKTTMPR